MTVRLRGPLAEWYHTLRPVGMLVPARLVRWPVLLLIVAGLALAAPAEAQLELYVYDRLAGGGLRLKRTIAAAGLSAPFGLALADDELFVANQSADSITNSVTIYDQSAGGDARFTQILGGPADPLVRASGVAVDPTNKHLFVAHGLVVPHFSVNVYRRLENGEFTLDRFLSGPELDHPAGLAVDLTRNELIVANTSTTNDQGSINRYPRTASGTTPPLPNPITGAELFSPVGLVLSQGDPFNYTLKNAGDVTVAPDSSVTTTITAELLVGSGTVAFRPVSGLPGGATASFSPETCRLPCSTTLTITTAASTPSGTTEITVRADGAQDGCSQCVVIRSTSFNVVTRRPPEGTLTVDIQGDGSGTVTGPGISCRPNCSATFPAGTVVTLTATPDASSIFARWSGGGCSGANPVCTLTLTASTTVTAFFDKTPPQVRLEVITTGSGTGTVAIDPGGVSCSSACSATFPAGTVVTLTATPASNSIFARWDGGGCSGANPVCTLTLTASTTVTATFDLRRVSLTVGKDGTGTGTVTSSPGGVACGSTCAAELTIGTRVTLSAGADSGSRFVRWTGGGCPAAEASCTLTLTEPTTVIATFNGVFSLTIAKTDNTEATDELHRTHGGGTVTVTASQEGRACNPPRAGCQEFDRNTDITITASTDPGSDFAGWLPTDESPCKGAQSCRFTLTKNVIVTAYFGSPQEAFIARLSLNVLRTTPTAGNTQSLIDALKPRPGRTVVEALFDAFFDGPVFFSFLSTLVPSDYVTVTYRAILGREPTSIEQAFFGPVVGNTQDQRFEGGKQLRRALIDDQEFQALLQRVFP